MESGWGGGGYGNTGDIGPYGAGGAPLGVKEACADGKASEPDAVGTMAG